MGLPDRLEPPAASRYAPNDRFKYIRTLEAGEQEELYDLESDPEELTNLALDARRATTLQTFRALAVKLKRTGEKMAERLPPVKMP